MKLRTSILLGCAALFTATSCTTTPAKKSWSEQVIENARAQIGLEIDTIEASGKCLNPVTLNSKGGVYYCGPADWRSGFFPGSVWYLYELTGDQTLLPLAQKYTEAISEAQYLTWHHDIGFIINCSFGNGLRINQKPEYKDVMIEAANSLCTRFREKPGTIQSWNVSGNSWQAQRGWECPVIIDNMMNLELLFEATRLSGDSTFYNIAVSHANTTMKNHFRADNSCYHVIDYSLKDGSVRNRHTAQGYAHESAWARGQAWAVYGFTTCYRYTHDKRYLDQAEKTLNFYLNDKNLPKDLIPYWDFDAPEIPNEPRDVSTAACIASALYEMDGYCPGKNYKELADKILKNLSGPDYKAKVGENGNFILMHSVGSIPHGAEIDVPLNYADYYYEEALIRKRNIENNQPFSFVNE